MVRLFYFVSKNIDPQPDPQVVELRCEIKYPREFMGRKLQQMEMAFRDERARLMDAIHDLQTENKTLHDKLDEMEKHKQILHDGIEPMKKNQ